MMVPNFSMMAFTSCIEPLRLANRVMGKKVYEWDLYGGDGKVVRASNGVEVAVNGTFRSLKKAAGAVVCAGLDVHTLDHAELLTALRRLVSHGASLCAVCTGTYILARGGFLDGYQSTIHWENRPGLMAEFPDLDVVDELFTIDRNRFTCAGGTAAIDMMLLIISRDHGRAVAAEVTDTLIHHRIRGSEEHQRMDLRSRLGVVHPKILSVVKHMEETIEAPLLCRDIARHAGISPRQLERLFAKYLGYSPTRHYLNIRLEHARQLLRQTSKSILDVALGTGYVSASHFSKSYHDYFGQTPSGERRLQRLDPASVATKMDPEQLLPID